MIVELLRPRVHERRDLRAALDLERAERVARRDHLVRLRVVRRQAVHLRALAAPLLDHVEGAPHHRECAQPEKVELRNAERVEVVLVVLHDRAPHGRRLDGCRSCPTDRPRARSRPGASSACAARPRTRPPPEAARRPGASPGQIPPRSARTPRPAPRGAPPRPPRDRCSAAAWRARTRPTAPRRTPGRRPGSPSARCTSARCTRSLRAPARSARTRSRGSPRAGCAPRRRRCPGPRSSRRPAPPTGSARTAARARRGRRR